MGTTQPEQPNRKRLLESEDSTSATSSDLDAEIARVAYDIFLARGGDDGDDLLDWLEAERIVHFRRASIDADGQLVDRQTPRPIAPSDRA
jgi:hypothetical protein